MLNKIIALILFPMVTLGCPAGTVDYEGHCADMQAPQTEAPVKPSDEKPPRSGKSADQDPTIHIDMPKSLTDADMSQIQPTDK